MRHCWLGMIALTLSLMATYQVDGQESGPGDLSTTNQDLTYSLFWNAVEASNGPVTVLAFGDSVSAEYRSLQTFLFYRLQGSLGWAGDTLGNFQNTALWQLGNGAAVEPPTTNWWATHALLPPGGFLFWTNQDYAQGSLTCNEVGVFWVAQPEGGAFTVAVSTNGGPWSEPVLNLDGYSSVPVGRYAKATLERQPYRLRVDGISGTNRILGPRYVDTTSAGVEVAFMNQDGASLDQIFAISTNVLYPILSAVNPQLVIWHMKELGDESEIGLSNRLFDLEALWKACVTNGDIVYVGTPYNVNDLTSNYTPTQNRLVRQAAVRDHRVYLDCMTPCVSYQSMTNYGFLDDGLHPSNLCYSFLAGIAWDELGFFALRVDRHITAQTSGTSLNLQWSTIPNLTYELQSSTNFSEWLTLGSFLGTGQAQIYTNAGAPSPTAAFRLRLKDQ